jgi:1-acyl-sn-glycerol-3-phosphate acyltransferase
VTLYYAIRDFGVTLILWTYFTVGFALFFAPFYLFCFCFSTQRQTAFQKLNCRFYRGLFGLLRLLIPRLKWHIEAKVRAIRGAVIVCNHISYLDSILLISLYERHTTIVKNRLFKIPIFKTMLRLSGYLPASGGRGFSDLMITQIDKLKACLAAGGNLIVFPEGTRRRNGVSGDIHPGAFKIARLTKTPLNVVTIENTERLFTPGKFRFNSGCDHVITLKFKAELQVGNSRDHLLGVISRVRSIFMNIPHGSTL